jgi:hypothetical protein
MERPARARPLDAPADSTRTHDPTAEPAAAAVLELGAACPLHSVLGELAQAAVRQHVLHLEGEVLPRADLVAEVDGWQQLYRLVRTQVCPATRTRPVPPAELDTLVDAAVCRRLPPSVPARIQQRLRRQLLACAACTSPAQCPLGQHTDGHRARGMVIH